MKQQKRPMKCPKCKSKLREVKVNVQGAKQRAVSFQCVKCDYFEFEPVSARMVVEELAESPLKIKQRVVKLSSERLGIYFNNHLVRSLNLKKGEEIYLSVPDKRHILMERE